MATTTPTPSFVGANLEAGHFGKYLIDPASQLRDVFLRRQLWRWIDPRQGVAVLVPGIDVTFPDDFPMTGQEVLDVSDRLFHLPVVEALDRSV